ncbi:NAD(P)H-binding protein [Streptomyces sp. NBC_01537]|uniref:NAD-dependent epimerase/dehydratase family protein n=1 Tax=Streptomyces sp. NBC_01537 TaxID=2903896 RepID=UPI003864D54F
MSATTTFVAGGTGFIGRAVVSELHAAGDRVQVLARSDDSARAVRALGAEPVAGDLSAPGAWQEQVRAADRVVHAAQPSTFGSRLTPRAARRYQAERLAQDDALLDAVAPGARVVYISGNSYFGETGPGAKRDESMKPNPTGFGPYVTEAVEAVRLRIEEGLDAVIAFPGAVYGDGAWLKQYALDPLRSGKPVGELAGPSHATSPVAVTDVGRAVAFLAAQPATSFEATGRLLFVVDDEPVTFHQINELAAQALGVQARYRAVPAPLMRLFAGQIGYEYLATDALYANARLTSLGFRFEHPTVREGLPALLSATA